jgi:predicted aspartyl protease
MTTEKGIAGILFTFPPMDRTKLVMKWVKCFGLDVKTIVDTGAGICVISPQLCSKLSIKTKSSWKVGQILTANGTPIIPERSAELVLMIDGQRILIEAAVLEMNGFDLLLGNDVLTM